MDDFTLNVRQIFQYPLQTTLGNGFLVVGQFGAGGAYGSIGLTDIVANSLWQDEAPLNLWQGAPIRWTQSTPGANGVAPPLPSDGTLRFYRGNGFQFVGGNIVVDGINTKAVNINGND